jgi:putative phosphoserine phosphatase/1-acylglycerol-3-phosphate O-acyltransferase
MVTTFSGVNPGLKGYTVFLDLDRTIISRISGRVLAVSAIRKGYVKPLQLVKILIHYLSYKTGIYPQSMAEKMIKWTIGIPESEFSELCKNTAENILLPSIYNESVSVIESHRRNNARIVILSASINQICDKVAVRLGIHDVISTSLEVKNGCLTGQSIGSVCFGDEKIKRLRDYCSYNNINISESWYYGDSITDLPVFLTVGYPICINPDNRLKKSAIQKGWKILTWSA